MKIIESQIRAQIQASLARGIRLFYVSTFEDSCTSEQALEVLMSLAAKGELEARADVYCPDGELCWGGTLEQLKTLKPFHCSECEQEIEDPKESSQTYFAVPAHIKSHDELSLAKAEIARLRYALEQIASPPGTHTMNSVRKIAAEALGAK